MVINKYVFVLLLLSLPLMLFSQSDRQYVRDGNRHFKKQDFEKAETSYRKALAQNGNNPQALYNLGCALMGQQKDSSAVVYLSQAGKMETSSLRKAMCFHNIGWVFQKHQLYADAISAYKESLRHNPSDDETRYNLALCQRLQKQSPQEDKQQKKDPENDEKEQQQEKSVQKEERKQLNDDKMSKETAEQLLNAAIQEERNTQEKMKKQRPSRKDLPKNW